ncbi:MAG: hypothetical protein ACREBB_01830 [Nitrosotalea sp.]
MERIELTTFVPQCKSIEYVIDSFEVPYQKILGASLEREIVRYVIIVPDNISHNIIEKLSVLLDTTQKDIYLTTQKTDATVSRYLDKLNEKAQKPKEVPLYEELIPITEPFIKFRKDLLIMIVIASIVALVGLYSNSPAVIIGAMLISPLLGPITAFSFNACSRKTTEDATFCILRCTAHTCCNRNWNFTYHNTVSHIEYAHNS